MTQKLRLTRFGRLSLVLAILVIVIIVLAITWSARSCSNNKVNEEIGTKSDTSITDNNSKEQTKIELEKGDEFDFEVEVMPSDQDVVVGKVKRHYLEELIFRESHEMLFGLPVNEFDIERSEIESGQTFSRLLNAKYDVNISIVNQLIEKCKGVFDLRDLRAGRNYTAFIRPNSDGNNVL